MFICCSTDDDTLLYVFEDKDDLSPSTFLVYPTFPRSKKISWVEMEENGGEDDDGYERESEINELEVYIVPTNAYKLIQFKSPREQARFEKLLNKYYGKEIKDERTIVNG